MTNKPTVLFVCVHNAGRSQMAAGFMRELGQGRVEVLSAGSAPKDSINPIAVEAMAEVGIDIANNTPKVLTTEAVEESDAVITMGCGDVCPFYPGKRYEDWVLDDPAGLLPRDGYVKINLDIDISFEEASFIREKLMPEHHLRELTLIPVKQNLEGDDKENANIQFESIDSIVQSQIEELQDGAFDKKLLLDIYRNL
jgi:arsenate reductase